MSSSSTSSDSTSNRGRDEISSLRTQVENLNHQLISKQKEIDDFREALAKKTAEDIQHQSDIGREQRETKSVLDIISAARIPLQKAGFMAIEQPHSALPAAVEKACKR